MVEKIKKLGFFKRAFSTYIDKIINKYLLNPQIPK